MDIYTFSEVDDSLHFDDKNQKNVDELKDLTQEQLLQLLDLEGIVQNRFKDRIGEALRCMHDHVGPNARGTTFVDAHGLDYTTPWPADADSDAAKKEIKALMQAGKGGLNEPKATRLWLAKQLVSLREEANKKVMLARGEMGGYQEVTEDIESILDHNVRLRKKEKGRER